MDENVQEKINQMQILQQNMENLSAQRQQFQMQETELETALSEIDKTEKTYKIIGSIMVLTDKSVLKNDLEERKQMLAIRISSIEKQESKLREKAEDIQKEVLAELEKKNAAKEQHTKPKK